ncbi:MAG: tRNA uridine-5-carboxymethylaminomethyl(34) synthesis GTPase MnmE [Ignavibacteriaceae bacterium]|nr:tRNA uridine-5-carboxymethylaminomethyl(34) synthesis GTPase MnmE [Ignavibacteriaceae bacterium]
MSFIEDTITALATPPGFGAISVIRVSGEASIAAVDNIFIGKRKLSVAKSHTVHYGKIFNSDEMIDDVLVTIFKAPNSYTGEDSVEISTHGNPLIAKTILELLTKNNVRLAEPGEFTKRAFLNNRLDLSQAEAVADVISSHTEASLRGARNQLNGLLSLKVDELRSLLLNAASFVELELDFAEEDVEFIGKKDLLARIDNILAEINTLLSTYSFGRILRDGVNVALVGVPNVGKSSLLNYLLKESRAIVSEIPGTTRDIIREEVSIDGFLFKLFDTAGLRFSKDPVELEGINRSREAIQSADIVLFINDVEQDFDQLLYNDVLKLNKKSKIITLLNKIDKGYKGDKKYDLTLSALTGEGIDILLKSLKNSALINSNYSEKTAVVSNLRHYQCLTKCQEDLSKARESTSNNMSGEFISVDLRNAINSLGEIIGEVTSEDVLNNIFTKFCIGK